MRKEGDLLFADADILVHQTNCIGLMGSGVAKQIHHKWPHIYEEYKLLCSSTSPENLLGHVQILPIGQGDKRYIANLFGQNRINRDWYLGRGQATDMDAVEKAINELRVKAREMGVSSIAFPYKCGCVRGGANWDEYLKKILTLEPEFEIVICSI